MKFVKFTILFVLMLFAFEVAKAQAPVYSQYMFNQFLINPAAAGADGLTSLNLTGREQWIGIPNSPKTHSVSVQTRVLKNSFIARALSLRKKFSKRSRSGRVGLGAQIYNDSWGIISRTGGQLTYAYHIPLRQSQLSFGLTMAFYQYKADRAAILNNMKDNPNMDSKDDILSSALSTINPDASFGAMFTTPLIHVGFSISDLFQSSLNITDTKSVTFRNLRTYNLMGGYKFEVNRRLMIEPSMLMKFTSQGFQMDLSTRAFYREDYWAGLSYRTGAGGGAIVVLTGLKVSKYYVGYAFDYTLSDVMKYTLGTHEFMVYVKFGENARRYRWLNRY